IRRNTDENFRQLRPFVGRTLTRDQIARIRDYANRFLDGSGPLFGRRVRDHRVRDCHRDVHAPSGFRPDAVMIFDCIDFNARFRYGDVASEIAFLAMDLAHYGRGDLAWELVDAYRAASGDDLPPPLLDFYACYRAVVRAKVESFKLDEAELTAEERREAARAARSYGDLADSYAGSNRRPMLLITC